MKKKWMLWGLLLLVVVILALPRENPSDFVMKLNQHPEPGVGNIRVLDVADLSGYEAVHVTFMLKSDAHPDTNWFIKDYKQTDSNLVLAYHTYEGYIYLVKKGLYTWNIVR
ncbi:MAG: hypothetical protein ACXVC1_00850 [Tumebacillaceae bacterium]